MGINYSQESFKIARSERNFRTLNYMRYGRGYTTFSPTEKIIDHSMQMARRDVPGLATLDTVMKVYRHNPDTISAFAHQWFEAPGRDPIGILAHLPLNQEGARALFTGELDTGNPELKFICRPHERAAALYFWFIYLPGGQGGGMSLVMERMTSAKNRDLPIFCKPANVQARYFFENMGFVMGATYEMLHSSTLMSCAMPDLARGRKPYDNYLPGENVGTKKNSVTVVHSLDDVLKCIAIRGAAYVEDRSIPYQEDVDGNDFTATHLLGYFGDEPAGCIRLRYWADFIKIERLAVLPRCRGGLALDLVRAAIAFGQDKGYRRFYGQAAQPLLKLWKHFGFVQRPGPGLSYLTDEVYYEMDLETEPKSAPMTHLSGAAVLIRPEGQWDRPGPLEEHSSSELIPNKALGADPAERSALVPNKALGAGSAARNYSVPESAPPPMQVDSKGLVDGKWVPGVSPTTMYPDRDIPGCMNPFYGEALIYGKIKGLNDHD